MDRGGPFLRSETAVSFSFIKNKENKRECSTGTSRFLAELGNKGMSPTAAGVISMGRPKTRYPKK